MPVKLPLCCVQRSLSCTPWSPKLVRDSINILKPSHVQFSQCQTQWHCAHYGENTMWDPFSAPKAKMGGVFLGSQVAVPILTTLSELGHPPPLQGTPFETDSSYAHGILTLQIFWHLLSLDQGQDSTRPVQYILGTRQARLCWILHEASPTCTSLVDLFTFSMRPTCSVKAHTCDGVKVWLH